MTGLLPKTKNLKWPEGLAMPLNFEATCIRYKYDRLTDTISFDDSYKSHKTRYIDADGNRYGLDSFGGNEFYQKRYDYESKTSVERINNGTCVFEKMP